jgi:hypothetical protein
MRMLSAQKRKKESHSVGRWPSTFVAPSASGQEAESDRKKVWSAWPPIQHWMPNQPHATMARMMAGTFAPKTPYAARAKTGNGIPYFVPGCELARMGTRTIALPIRMVSSACHQFIPVPMRPDAIMYVGMQWAIEIHSAAYVYVVQVRFSSVVGARSWL